MAEIRVPGCAPFRLFVHPRGELVSDRLVEAGVWEPFESTVFCRSLRAGDRVLDAGANLGYYTHLAAQRVGPGGRVMAFEPDPDTCRLLRANVAALPADVVDVRQEALGDRRGRAALADDLVNKGDAHLSTAGGRPVSVCRGDDLNLPRIDMLKIDTQGAECKVLRGLHNTLQRSGAGLSMLIELWPYGLQRSGDSAAALVDLLLELDLPVWRLDHEQCRLWPLPADELTYLALHTLTVRQRGFVNLLLTNRPLNSGAAGDRAG